MPDIPDAASLLHELLSDRPADPFDPDGPVARASLERILTAPPLPPAPGGRHRRPARGLVVAGAAACVAVTAVAFSPSVGGSPDVIARAAAALSQPHTILHFKADVYVKPDSPRQISADPSLDKLYQTIEAWQSPGARQRRELYAGPGNPGGDEFVEDSDAKTTQAYNGELNQLIDNNDPRLFAADSSLGDSGTITGLGGSNVIDDLQTLVKQARDGAGNIALVGRSTIRGMSVYELRLDRTVDVVSNPSGAVITDPARTPTTPLHLPTLVYVNSQTYLPVRIVDLAPPVPALGPNDVVERVTDYVLTERLPDTPANRRQLLMSPHSGATRVDTTAASKAMP